MNYKLLSIMIGSMFSVGTFSEDEKSHDRPQIHKNGDRIRKKLNLNDEQWAALKSSREMGRERRQQLRESMKSVREKLKSGRDGNIDPNELARLKEEKAALKDEIKQHRESQLNSLKGVLSENQLAQMKEIRQKRKQRRRQKRKLSKSQN